MLTVCPLSSYIERGEVGEIIVKEMSDVNLIIEGVLDSENNSGTK